MTQARSFVDTNVFAYALDHNYDEKRLQAIQLIDDHRDTIVVSTQVLIELYAVCTRKLRMERADARRAVEAIAGFAVVDTTRDRVLSATALAESAQISIFDAAIIRAAQHADCGVIWTEDLNSGQQFDQLLVKNPFAQ